MEKKYYLPIGSTSLAHYFGCACIKPSKYFDNKQEDLQDKFNDFLLVTTYLGTQQTDCCLELVLTGQEARELIPLKNGFFLYEKPLPITRVRKIYFSNKERKEQTITNINMSTAFVPDELVEIKEFDNIQANDLEKPQDIHIAPYNEQLKRFNSFLGGFALMRLAGEDYMNYSENYFATLSLFNSVIHRDLEDSKISIDPRYRGAFTGESGFQKIIPYLNKTIDESDINSIAQDENQIIQKDKITRIIELNSLDKNTYIVAVLNTYGVGSESKRKRIDELILSNFKSDIKTGKSEGIALCYGINRGYSAFSNKYSLNKNEKVVKFQLNSQLDYYTIESLYQYTFNDVKSDEFSYLKDWCPKQKRSKINKKTDYKILDVIVIGKKKAKVLSKEYWENLLPSFFQINKFTEKTLPEIYRELGEVVFNDAKEEIVDDYENQIAQKQEEIDNLKAEQKKMLQETQKPIITKEYKQREKQSIPAIVEPTDPYFPKQDIDIKNIVEQTLKYKEKTQTMLKNEAKEKGIAISKGMKQDDIIVLLMTTKNKNLFSNE
ncbi:hypothetical protein [Parabacteroides goldsteinii]|jgi:hypothetical protein|uniref:hypothetical protein n=1 Tax=Parabacteroides goldsteinii TaxID=328812 RepID=UPI0015BB69EE|nr:hypothetical protein [Parabacteroides goldsteinii]MBS6577884.1 hypothetical protein [Parabacteroides goldsteinii]